MIRVLLQKCLDQLPAFGGDIIVGRMQLSTYCVLRVIEGILSKYDDIKENSQTPKLQLRALIGTTLEHFWGAIFNRAIESVEPLARLEKHSTAKVNQLAR